MRFHVAKGAVADPRQDLAVPSGRTAATEWFLEFNSLQFQDFQLELVPAWCRTALTSKAFGSKEPSMTLCMFIGSMCPARAHGSLSTACMSGWIAVHRLARKSRRLLLQT